MLNSKGLAIFYSFFALSCYVPKHSASLFYKDTQLRYRNVSFGYYNEFSGADKSVDSYNLKKYHRLKNNEFIDFIVRSPGHLYYKSYQYPYYKVGLTSIMKIDDLTMFRAGIAIDCKMNDCGDGYEGNVKIINKIGRYSIYYSKQGFKSDSFNIKLNVLLKYKDTNHFVIFIMDSNEVAKHNYDGIMYGAIKNFTKDAIPYVKFEIDSQRLSSTKYLQYKVDHAQKYLSFFSDVLSEVDKSNVNAFIHKFR